MPIIHDIFAARYRKKQVAVPDKIESLDVRGSGLHIHPTKREKAQTIFDKVLLSQLRDVEREFSENVLKGNR